MRMALLSLAVSALFGLCPAFAASPEQMRLAAQKLQDDHTKYQGGFASPFLSAQIGNDEPSLEFYSGNYHIGVALTKSEGMPPVFVIAWFEEHEGVRYVTMLADRGLTGKVTCMARGTTGAVSLGGFVSPTAEPERLPAVWQARFDEIIEKLMLF